MPTYIIRLRDLEETVEVPMTVKGLTNAAEYISSHLAEKFARAVTPHDPLETYENRLSANRSAWHDSHVFAITDLLRDLKTKLER